MKMSSGVVHQWRAIGHLDHAAVGVIVLEDAERAGRREHDEYAKVSYRDVSLCRAFRRLEDGGLRERQRPK